jgi:hypothetical protein
MSDSTLDESQLKTLFKTAIIEIMQEQKELFKELITEAMEDIALAKAIEEGETTDRVSRDVIFQLLDRQS